MNKRGKLLVALGVALAVGYILYSLTAVGEVSCQACIAYKGRTDCRAATGANREEAQRTAVDVACSLLTSSMAEGINCTNTPPTSVACEAR